MAKRMKEKPFRPGQPHSHLQKQLISLRELADRWDVSRATVRRRLRDGGVRAYYIGGDGMNATIRYSTEDVEVFLRRCLGK